MTKQIISLMDNWLFVQLPAGTPDPAATKGQALIPISLPHVFNKDEPATVACGYYKTSFTVNCKQDKAFYLAFDAVSSVARVYLNGSFLGEHRGGYSRFVLKASQAVTEGENTLEVLADNTRFPDVCPLVGDFTLWGGIYRPVSLIVAPLTHLDPSYYGAPALSLAAYPDGRLEVDTRVVNGAKACVRYQVKDAAGNIVVSVSLPAGETKTTLNVENPHLWNGLSDPYLYTCTAELWQDGELLDSESLHCGFRSIELDAKTGFALNGRQLRLHGVAKHQDRAGAACAVSDAQQEEDIALIRQIGANAVRLSHYQHPQHTYDLCDQQGLVAWAEIPMLAMPDGNDGVVENARKQLTELILQNRHHPSICFWGIQNEIAMLGEYEQMYANVAELNALAKSLDATRISGAANLYSVKNDSKLNFISDAVGYNIYFGWYYGKLEDNADFIARFHEDNPTVPLGITEYGVDCNIAYHTDTPECRDYTEEYQALYHEKAYEAFEADASLWGSFVWNMFDFSSAIRDEGGVKQQNTKGLVTYDRQICKDSFYYYQAAWAAAPMVHINGRRYVNRTGAVTTVSVYSNQPEVTLTVNGEPFKALTGRRKFVFSDVPLSEKTTITAIAGKQQDEITICKVESPDKSYTYPKKGEGQRVTNWFLTDAGKENLTPQGAYSLSDKIGELLANERTLAVLEEYLPDVAHDKRAAQFGGMTLLRVLDRSGDKYDTDTIKKANAALNRIRK